jgi:sterol 3beta-glucosyltransferase
VWRSTSFSNFRLTLWQYFFSFFNHAQDALTVLRIMINDNEHHQSAQRHGDHSAITPTTLSALNKTNSIGSQGGPIHAPCIEENVRATLSPLPAPLVGRSSMSADSRSSLDVNRQSLDVRRSMDASHTLRRPSYETRRSYSGTRQDKQSKSRPGDKPPLSPKPQDTSYSATNSLGPGTESSAAIQSIDESSASASQILGRSDVFYAPALQSTNTAASEQSDSLTRRSQDTTPSSSGRKPQSKAPNPSRKFSNSPIAPDLRDDQDGQHLNTRISGSSTALQGITSYPLKQASGLAGFLRTRSKKVGNLLASESMGYYEKVSGMLAGGRKHYQTADGLQPDDQVQGLEEDEDATKAAEHFREHFAFPDTEQLQSSYFASLQRILPNYGKIYISGRYFCFRSLMPTLKTKVRIGRLAPGPS